MCRLLVTTSIIITILGLSACNGDHWGAEKKEKLTGERIAIVLAPDELRLDNAKNLPLETTKVLNNDDWTISVASSTKLGGNLHLTNTPTKSLSLKVTGNSRFGFISTPIVHDGTIYILDTQGDITAFTLKTGKKLWQNKGLRQAARVKSPSFLNGGMMLANNIIYATTGLNSVVAIDAKSGQNKWSTILRSPSRAVPVLAGNLLIVQSIDNISYALDAINGGIIWAHIGMSGEAQALVPVMPAVDHEGIIVQYSAGEVYKLSPHDGEEIWHTNIAPHTALALADQSISRTALMPLLQHNKIFAVSPEGKLLCLNAHDGEFIWQKDLHIDGSIWLTDHYIYAITATQQLLAINQQDGLIKWYTDVAAHFEKKKKPAPAPNLSAPIVADNQVLLNTSDGQQLRFNVHDGKFSGKVGIPRDAILPPVIADGKMYILSNTGQVKGH